MKLLNRPEIVTDTYELSGPCGNVRYPGRTTLRNVKILCPCAPQNAAEELWQRLKYGPVLDMGISIKIDRIEFHEKDEDVVLYGVLPIKVQRTEISEGRVFECHVDLYEIIPH